MKTVLFKRIIISVFLQTLFALSLFGQKYQNGTRLLKGAEVLSATPLQLDYVLEKLADTAKIDVNIHEGKTHLVLDDGSGKWHEWWFYMGKWQPKNATETDPVWTAAQGNYFTKTNLQTSGQAQVHWDNISNKPATGAGTVTSVGLALPNIFTVTGSPVTTTGTLSATLASQTKNTVWAAPTMANGIPTFRALQESDIPSLNWSKIYNTPTLLGDYGITNAYTKTETNALMDIAGNDYQMLMLYNKRPVVIPRTNVVVQPTHTQFTYSGYEKTWEYPDIRIPASMLVDATGFNFSGSWMNYQTAMETRSGMLSFNVLDLDDYTSQTALRMNSYSISQDAAIIYWDTKRGYHLNVGDTDNRNTFWSMPDQSKLEIRKKQGDNTYHTDFAINNGSLQFTHSIEENTMVRQLRNFYVGQSFIYDRYFYYTPYDSTLRVLNAVNLSTFDDGDAARIAITDDKDIQFSSKASVGQTEQSSITLTDIIHKGQIITQATEPTIPEGSFAFWVNGSNFYLVMRTNGVQKKTQLQ